MYPMRNTRQKTAKRRASKCTAAVSGRDLKSRVHTALGIYTVDGGMSHVLCYCGARRGRGYCARIVGCGVLDVLLVRRARVVRDVLHAGAVCRSQCRAGGSAQHRYVESRQWRVEDTQQREEEYIHNTHTPLQHPHTSSTPTPHTAAVQNDNRLRRRSSRRGSGQKQQAGRGLVAGYSVQGNGVASGRL